MKKKIAAILLFLLILAAPTFKAYAEEDLMGETSETTTITAELDVPVVDESSALEMDTLDVDDTAEVSTTPFSTDYLKTALFSDIIQGFIIGDWDVLDARLNLSFSTTQLASENLSNITLSINGVRFYSETVPPTDGNRRELSVRIPAEFLVPGYNALTIESYIRTQDGLPCVDDVTSANWLNVFKESFIAVSYHPSLSCSSIAEFYGAFTSIDALENSRSAVVLPAQYSAEELDAALTILSGVSGNADKSYQNIALLRADDSMIKQYDYLIYSGKFDNWPDIADDAEAANQAAGVLALKRGNPNILYVTGGNDLALDRAAAALANPDWMRQLNGTEKVIGESEDIWVRHPDDSRFTSLTDTGAYLDGPFRQSIDFFVDFDDNQTIAYGSSLTLNFRYSENLDFKRSLVSIYINDTPIGSKKLSAESADGDTLVLEIPTDIEVVGDFMLTVAFDLELPDVWCTLRQEETPWAWVAPSSELKISGTDVPYFLFENFPYPFVSQGAFNDAVIVLPDDIGLVDLDLLGGFALTLGQFIEDNSGTLNVVPASGCGDLNGKNVIAVGTYNDNAFIADLNDSLFFKFYSNGAGITSNEKMLIEPQYSTSLATAQLIDSPYSETRNAVLVMAAANSRDLPNVFAFFKDASALWELYGDGFVTDGDDIFLFRFKSENEKETPAAQTLLSRPDLFTLALAGAALLLLIIVALILMLVKYRRRKQE